MELPETLPPGSLSVARTPRVPTIRRRFYVAVGIWMTVLVVAGFWNSYFGPLVRWRLDQPALLHVHAAVFLGWVALFIAQVTSAARGQIGRHMQLGKIGIGYGFTLIVVGVMTGIGRAAARVAAGQNGENILYVALFDMALFTLFFVPAVANRRVPRLHKRLMLVAANVLLVAAVFRLPIYPEGLAGVHTRLAIWALPILAAIAYDLRKEEGVHPIYLLGLSGLVVRNYSEFLADTEGWAALTRVVTGWVL